MEKLIQNLKDEKTSKKNKQNFQDIENYYGALKEQLIEKEKEI